jgi:allantoicase
VRLSIYPDGGVARFRVHGEPRPHAALLTGTIDLAAAENGGRVVDCSDMFYSSPNNLLLPGRARTMGDGWENARRRDEGNDHVTVRLAGRGVVRRVEIDTSYFVGNPPGWASLTGDDGVVLVPRTRLQPDTRHFFVVSAAEPVSQVRLDVYPDGGLARLRVWGELV